MGVRTDRWRSALGRGARLGGLALALLPPPLVASLPPGFAAELGARLAAEPPSLEFGGVASLHLEIDRRGDAEVYLWADGARLSGHCSGVLRRAGGWLTGDPEAMISALGKLARLNLTPLSWGRLTESLATHPALDRRALALAKRSSISSSRVPELLRGEDRAPGPGWELRRRIADRLRLEGLGPEVDGGVFCGFAPHGEPRFYEGYSSWDAGFLLLGREDLVWLGDRLRFRLAKSALEDVRLGRGMPYFWPMPNLYFDWRGPDGALRTFYLRAGAISFYAVRLKTLALARRVEAWRREGSGAGPLSASLGELGPPIVAEVTSVDPRRSLRWRSVLSAAWLYAFLTLAACTILGRTRVAWPAALMAVGVLLALLLPNFVVCLQRRSR